MRKTALLVLSILLALTMVSCKTGDTDLSDASSEQGITFSTVNVGEYAGKGIMYPLEIKLGDTADTVKSHYKVSSETPETADESGTPEDEQALITVNDTSEYTEMASVNEIYYYRPHSDKKITAIVSYNDPYGYPLYTATEENVKTLLGEPERSGAAEDGDIFFMFGTSADMYKVLVYTYGQNRLTFIFYEDTMMAATLIDTQGWNTAQ